MEGSKEKEKKRAVPLMEEYLPLAHFNYECIPKVRVIVSKG
jgi:hypothetical protein